MFLLKPHLFSGVGQHQTDAVLLIPLALDRHGNLGIREEMNAIAMLAEVFINRKGIRSVFLSTPFPLAPDLHADYAEADRRYGEYLRKLRREKGLRLIELDALLRKSGEWTSDAYSVNGEKTGLPYGLTDASVEILSSEIEGK